MKVNINNNTNYEVHLSNDFITILDKYIDNNYILCLDQKVSLLYKDKLEQLTSNALTTIIIDAHEDNKTMKTIEYIHTTFNQYNVNRKTKIICIGGGLVGDVVGFACSIYLRGIPYIQVPTTLLAQVDSSIGAKVGVNAFDNKNYIGSFYPPLTTIIDISFLKTLSTRLFKEGLVELIKHGLIKDKSIIEDLGLYKNIDELRKDDFNLLRLIEKSLKVKQYYVESDYQDLGLRNTLNFGHAFGHALELDNNLYHGECVAIGILVNTIKTSFYNEIEELFQRLELIKEFPTLNLEKMKQDKKQANNIIDEVFLNSIGEAIIKKTDINKLISLYQENYQLLQTNYQLAPSLFQITNNNLSGTITIPPSKSQLHRYLIASALSYTKTTLYNITSLNDDIKVTINALKYLDTSITYNKEDSTLIIEPSLYNDLPQTLNMKESGSSLRLLLPLLISKEIEITGENKLPTRPLDTYLDIFNKQNIKIDKQEDNLPLKLSGTLKPDNFIIEENKSSQFISGLLFALPLLKNDSTITCRNIPSSLPYIKMTLNTLHDFGINIEVNNDYTYYKISGNQKYTSKESYNIEQDYSSRCFFEVLNKFDNQEITITNKMEQSIQGDYKVVQLVQEGCNELDLNDMPDAGAIMAIYFSINGGILTNIQRLIHKESNRLEAIKMMLDNFNIKYLQKENTLEIYPSKLVGNKQETFHDHRITMSIIIGATIAKNATYIDEIKSINKSYPSFIDDYILLGGLIDEK